MIQDAPAERPIDRAVRLAGNQTRLAALVHVRPQAVQLWVSSGQVSHKKVVAVAKATGVPCHELRPDLYPSPMYIAHDTPST